MAKKGQLVSQYLERISADVFDKYIAIIKGYVGRRQGVYALYKGNRLYYVGLASNMNARLKQHLRDKHEGKWNKFSVYLTIGDTHLREIESLVLRVIQPPGNSVKGKLKFAQDLRRNMRSDVHSHLKRETDRLFGFERDIEVVESYSKKGRTPILYPHRNKVKFGFYFYL